MASALDLAGIEAYSPCDHMSELTARTNDEGWDTVFAEWLGSVGRDGGYTRQVGDEVIVAPTSTPRW